MIKTTGKVTKWKPSVIRYADDLIILHRDLEEIERAKHLAQKWLAKMGLEFSAEKTKICHTYHEHDGHKPGFEFLGFSFRQFKLGKRNRRLVANPYGVREAEHKTIITPTNDAIKRQKAKLSQIIDGLKTATQEKLILALGTTRTLSRQ